MKALYDAIRNLLLPSKAPTFNSSAARAFAALPEELREALRNFERSNRGHRHLLAAQAHVLNVPTPGTTEHAQRQVINDSCNTLFEALLKLTELPEDPALTTLLDAPEALGWLGMHAEVRLWRKLSRRVGLPSRFVLESWSTTYGGTKCQVNLVVRHRRLALTIGRTISIPAGTYDTLRQAYCTSHAMEKSVYELFAGVEEWPEFVEAERAETKPQQLVLDRARAQIQEALNPFSQAEREQIVRSWMALCPAPAGA